MVACFLPPFPPSCVNIYSSRGVLSSLFLLFLSTLASPELRGEREKMQFVKGGVASREKTTTGGSNFPKMQKCSLSLEMFHANGKFEKNSNGSWSYNRQLCKQTIFFAWSRAADFFLFLLSTVSHMRKSRIFPSLPDLGDVGELRQNFRRDYCLSFPSRILRGNRATWTFKIDKRWRFLMF